MWLESASNWASFVSYSIIKIRKVSNKGYTRTVHCKIGLGNTNDLTWQLRSIQTQLAQSLKNLNPGPTDKDPNLHEDTSSLKLYLKKTNNAPAKSNATSA